MKRTEETICIISTGLLQTEPMKVMREQVAGQAVFINIGLCIQ